MTRPGGVVPAQLVPAWGDLPALAGVQARAFGPRRAPRWMGRILGAVALPIWLAGLAGMHWKCGVAASRRRAVVTISRISRLMDPRGITLLFVFLATVFLASLVAAIVVGWVWVAVLVGVILVGLASMQPWRVIAHQGALARLYAWIRQRDSDVPVYEVGGLAAWPQGRGHGWRLFETLLAETDVQGYLVAFPRDARLRRRYLELGMVEHEPNGALFVDVRAQR